MAISKQFASFMLNAITGVSYVGKPQNNTMMYLTKKIEDKLALLKDVANCLIFLEDNIDVPQDIAEKNQIVLVKDPAKAYTEVALELDKQISLENSRRSVKFTEGGYFLGENVQIGAGVLIEPGAYIDHDVILMDGVHIKTGARIRYGTIVGTRSVICENAVVGDPAFNTAKFEDGSVKMIPSFGKIYIGANVYIGANTTISRGGADNTIIEDEVKIDSNIRIGHDVHLKKGVELLGCCAVAGYCEIGENSVIAANATVKNRTKVGRDCYVGMGSVVHHNVRDGLTISGSPAKTLEQIGKDRYFNVQLKELLRKQGNDNGGN